MKTFINTFLVAALLVSFSTDLQAQRNNQFNKQQAPGYYQMGQFNNYGPMQGQRMITLLNLTEEQQEQAQKHWVEGQQEMLPLRNELGEKSARLQTLTTSGNYDEAAVNALIKDIGDLKTKIMLLREEHRQEMRSFLTDEQKVIFDSARGNRGTRGMRASGRSGRGGNYCPGFRYQL